MELSSCSRAKIHTTLLAGTLILATTGCAATMYEGAHKPTTETSAIETDHAKIDSIDGKQAPAATRLMVLPGEHRIALVLPETLDSLPSSPTRLTVCVTTQAGHGYVARLSRSAGQWRPEVSDSNSGDRVHTRPYDPAQGRCVPDAPPPIPAAQASAEETPSEPRPPAWETPPRDNDAPAPRRLPGWSSPPGDREQPQLSGQANRPGTSLDFRFGYAFGGDNLITATMSNGSKPTIDAGKGGLLSLGLTVTPLWAGESIGFGGGAEIGWKSDEIKASNATITLNRFPLVASLHLLSLLSERWYLRFAGGLATDLGVHLSGDGDAAGLSADFTSSLGGMGELAVYYRSFRHFSIDFGLRFTALKYSIQGQSIDAKSLGFLLGVHYEI